MILFFMLLSLILLMSVFMVLFFMQPLKLVKFKNYNKVSSVRGPVSFVKWFKKLTSMCCCSSGTGKWPEGLNEFKLDFASGLSIFFCFVLLNMGLAFVWWKTQGWV